MAYDGWMTYAGEELFNTSRTAQLAQTLGITAVWISPSETAWIQTALSGTGYGNVAQAPWYDSGAPASAEFAGILPLEVTGLDDSSTVSSPIEYTTDGGHPGSARNTTLALVFNVALVASTERGAEFGRRWLGQILRGSAGGPLACGGEDLHYFRYGAAGSEIVHRRRVKIARGVSVTRKRRADCSSVWMATFTLTAADPFEYGPLIPAVTTLSQASTTGPLVNAWGTTDQPYAPCPVYDYSPVQDPLAPALINSPTAPRFYPDSWTITNGQTFHRRWTRLYPVEPSDMSLVPYITVRTADGSEARNIRVAIYDGTVATTRQCPPLFSAIITYIPANKTLYIDGRTKTVYVWATGDDAVRRADTLVFGEDANPLTWTAFDNPDTLFVALDMFASAPGVYPNAIATVGFHHKSD